MKDEYRRDLERLQKGAGYRNDESGQYLNHTDAALVEIFRILVDILEELEKRPER